jgi:hypothetical protein
VEVLKKPDIENNKNTNDIWYRIAKKTSDGLATVREEWLKLCMQNLQANENFRVKIINLNLGGQGELSLKAYQMLIATDFIIKKRYIQKDEQKYFTETLQALVGGEDHEACLSYLDYYRKNDEKSTQIFSLARDIMNYVSTEMQPVFIESGLLSTKVQLLDLYTRMQIAEVFRDSKTFRELRDELNDFMMVSDKKSSRSLLFTSLKKMSTIILMYTIAFVIAIGLFKLNEQLGEVVFFFYLAFMIFEGTRLFFEVKTDLKKVTRRLIWTIKGEKLSNSVLYLWGSKFLPLLQIIIMIIFIILIGIIVF